MVRSAPAQNASLPEVSTAPLMAASVATCSTMAASSSITFASMTFIERPGMFQVTSAMPSASISKLKFWYVMFESPRHISVRLAPAGEGELFRIWCAVLVGVPPAVFVTNHNQIDIGIFGAFNFERVPISR